jgi:7-cyano-7-deazaguanine reductase
VHPAITVPASMNSTTPLGKETGYPDRYTREVLCRVPRVENRRKLGIDEALPFRGKDVWNAYELTWLERTGKPVVAVAAIEVDADSKHMVESKSLKLYLNSLAMERFASIDEVAALVSRDLSEVTQSNVTVGLMSPAAVDAEGIRGFPGTCVDAIEVSCASWEVDSSLLGCAAGDIVREVLHSHLLRSRCPVTGQPDFGSVLVRYRGEPIDRAGLLRYLVSYRNHCDFHESCIERIFVDLKKRCAPQELTVYGRFNRRGGLDINPFRTDSDDTPDNPRLWRQ